MNQNHHDRERVEFPYRTPSDHIDDVLIGTLPTTTLDGRPLLQDGTYRLLRRWNDGDPALVIQELQADGSGLRQELERPQIVGEIVLRRFDGDCVETVRLALKLLEQEEQSERIALGMWPAEADLEGDLPAPENDCDKTAERLALVLVKSVDGAA